MKRTDDVVPSPCTGGGKCKGVEGVAGRCREGRGARRASSRTVTSSWAVAVRAIIMAVGCWICISWRSTLPSLVSLTCPEPSTSIFSVPRGPGGDRSKYVAHQHPLSLQAPLALTKVRAHDLCKPSRRLHVDGQRLRAPDHLCIRIHELQGAGRNGCRMLRFRSSIRAHAGVHLEAARVAKTSRPTSPRLESAMPPSPGTPWPNWRGGSPSSRLFWAAQDHPQRAHMYH